MIKTIYFFLAILFFFSCDSLKNKESRFENHLVVTSSGDTLESGFWKYDMSANGMSESGTYVDGYRVNQWIYKTNLDSIGITWDIFSNKDVKFNIPNYFKAIDSVKSPVLFQADIEDNDNNTYLILLRYNLKELNSSVYGYLYQLNQLLENDSSEVLLSKEFKKFIFKKNEIFRVKIETDKKKKYAATSYIFVVNDFLYDLGYKSVLNKNSAIDLEIFNNIFYSIECDNVRLFNYNNKKYLKEENVVFK